MSPEYTDFLHALGALAKVAALSLVLERAMAWLFENELINIVLTKPGTPTDAQPTPARTSRIPGLKSFVVFIVAAIICFKYQVNVFCSLLHTGNTYSADELGILLTAGVVAGGSAGAIALFQGVLNLNKEVRDAQKEAKVAEAQSVKTVALAKAGEASARKEEAEHHALQAKADNVTAEAKAKLTTLSLDAALNALKH